MSKQVGELFYALSPASIVRARVSFLDPRAARGRNRGLHQTPQGGVGGTFTRTPFSKIERSQRLRRSLATCHSDQQVVHLRLLHLVQELGIHSHGASSEPSSRALKHRRPQHLTLCRVDKSRRPHPGCRSAIVPRPPPPQKACPLAQASTTKSLTLHVDVEH